MKHLLRMCFVALVIGVILLGMGAKGCPMGVGLWTTQNEVMISGSSQPLPSAVTSLRISSIDQQAVYLCWEDNSNNEESVRIERRNLSSEYAEIGFVDADITQYADTTISPTTAYYYRIRAYNGNGYSMYSNEVSTFDYPPEIPAIPYNLSATATSNSQIDLGWWETYTGPLDFPIQYRVGTDTNWSQVAVLTVFNDPEVILEFSHTGLISPTGTYFYRVSARNKTGQSDWSNECWVIMPPE